MRYVIDPSVALAWLLPDESSPRAAALRQEIENGAELLIPSHWWLELGNGLLVAERRGRINATQLEHGLSLARSLPLLLDEETGIHVSGRTFALARKHMLTIYAAAYLELAQRRAATLASFDAPLCQAAHKERVSTE